jgi:hypothetical protein
MSGLPRETLEVIASWAEILTAAFGILAAIAAVVYLLANKPLKEFEAHDNEVLRGTVAEQQIRAATAEKELLELRERIKPRSLTDQQSIDFVSALKTAPGTRINFGYTSGSGDEGLNFLKQLLPLFKEAKWEIPEKMTGIVNHLEIQVIGVGVLVPDPHNTDRASVPPPGVLHLAPVETAMRDAFKAVGIDVQFISWYSTPDERPELVIGSKPNPAEATHKLSSSLGESGQNGKSSTP